MDVATVIERVANLSLSGSAEDDTAAQAMILGWVQSTYDEVWGEIATEAPTFLETTEEVTVTDGEGEMDAWPMDIKSVADLTNNTFLKVTTEGEVEQKDIALEAEGVPQAYYVTGGNVLRVWRKASITARVRLTPFAGVLETGGTESTIRFPPQYHDVLVWGALRFAAYDERDKGIGVELQATDTMFKTRKAALIEWVRTHQPKPAQQTVGYLK